VTTSVTYAAPHHLVADSGTAHLRRTRAGDAWELAQARPDEAGGSASGTFLGLPGLGTPVGG